MGRRSLDMAQVGILLLEVVEVELLLHRMGRLRNVAVDGRNLLEVESVSGILGRSSPEVGHGLEIVLDRSHVETSLEEVGHLEDLGDRSNHHGGLEVVSADGRRGHRGVLLGSGPR